MSFHLTTVGKGQTRFLSIIGQAPAVLHEGEPETDLGKPERESGKILTEKEKPKILDVNWLSPGKTYTVV